MLRSLHQIEFLLLAGMTASLTLSKSLQSIFFIAFAACWLTRCCLEHRWGGPWNYWDSLIALWISAVVAVDINGALHGLNLSVISDFARYSIFLWLISRTMLSEKKLGILFIILVVSTLIGLGLGYYHLYFLNYRDLEIPQIGHVNHSAIYLEFVFSISLSVLLSCWSTLKLWKRILLFISIIIFLNALFDGLSRAAVATALATIFMIGVLLSRRKLIYLPIMIIGLGLITSSLWIHPFQTPHFKTPPILEKERTHEKAFKNVISDRAELRQTAFWIWQKHPWLGAGIHNFQAEGKAIVEEKSLTAGHPITLYTTYSHAHNIYLNTLAEQGVVGFGALVLIFIAWIFLLLKHWPNRFDNNFYWALWLSSSCVLLSNLVIGWANTPLHHQNALLSLLLLGLSIAYFKRHLIR